MGSQSKDKYRFLMLMTNLHTAGCSWYITWKKEAFRKSMYGALTGLGLIILFIPYFFCEIEKRNGRVLNDRILAHLPVYNVSVFIFILLYGSLLWMAVKLFNNPVAVLTIFWGYTILSVFRMITISLVALNPPNGIIVLSDPFSVLFYHNQHVTKDLFFSGHTSIICLVTLCLPVKNQQFKGFILAFLMAVLLLIQHAHYAIDVLAAPVFSWISYQMARFLMRYYKIEMA